MHSKFQIFLIFEAQNRKKMREILHSYKLRLTNISQGNRAIKLMKLSPRRDMDFTNLAFLEEDSAEDLFRKVLSGKNHRLIHKLDSRHEKTNLIDKQLNLIYRELQAIYEETGTQDLYVGYPFVEGKFADGTPVRCPVLLFPVSLIRNLQGKPRWMLETPKDGEIIVNTSFFLAYELHQNTRIPATFWDEVPEYSEDWTAFLQDFYQLLKKYEIEINFNYVLFEQKIIPFVAWNKEKTDSLPVGILTFQSNVILGIFPQSDSALLQDYETLEADTEGFDLARFFTPADQRVERWQSLHTIPEALRFFVTRIDKSQEEVLLKIKSGQSLVVHGPPGTGKSQVIVNMIADALAHGKKVLVVSQKRAALDVVYKRVSALGLGDFAALVHDQQSDRVPIFQKIKKQIEEIPQFQRAIQAFETLSMQGGFETWAKHADNMRVYYDDLYEALTCIQPFGSTVHALYLETDRENAHYNFTPYAPKFKIENFKSLIDKLLKISDYSEFFLPDYPWAERMSFHLSEYQDKFSLIEKITSLRQIQEALHTQYHGLRKILGEEIADIGENRKKITAFTQLGGFFQDTKILQSLKVLSQDGLNPQSLEAIIQETEICFKKIENTRLLKGEKWETLLALLEKYSTFITKKGEALRIFSGEYHKANRFIQTHFQTKGLSWNDKQLPLLSEEMRILNQFLALHNRLLRFAFFNDLQTAHFFEGWESWIERKKSVLNVWKSIQEVRYFQAHQPEFVQGELNQEKWQQSLKIISMLASFSDSIAQIAKTWTSFLHPSQFLKLNAEIFGETLSFADRLAESLVSDFEDLCQADKILHTLLPQEQAVLALLLPDIRKNAGVLQQKAIQQQFVKTVKDSMYSAWIQQAEKDFPILVEVSTRGFARKQVDYADILSHKRNALIQNILYLLQKRIAGVPVTDKNKTPLAFREMLHQVSKKRKLWTVRKMIHTFWEQGLPELLPCWMASPESISAIFPMAENYFDLVIFDEASQCFVERAIPIMLRGRQTVIAGDSKQLQPFDMYSVRYEEGELIENEMVSEAESILDLAKTHWEGARLNWHYRSKEEELINFSNQVFYEGKLQVIPAAKPEEAFLPPLEWVSVSGEWKQNRNEPEARTVIDIVLKWVNTPAPPSIGIVTFNYFQQELIKDLLDKKLEECTVSDPTLYEKLQSALQKTENGEFMGLFVKNIENVQGDERDLMIFSIGYARNEQGKLSAHFGLLNLQGGENRLNVAITRARKKVYVVCSFNPSELITEGAKYGGPRLLKSYLQYVKAVSENREEEARQLLQSTTPTPISFTQNPIADFLVSKLADAGYFVIKNLGDTRYKLDIAVKKREEDRDFVLAIECEGENYFSGETAKEREVYRRELLILHGWKVYRVWARNFWINKEKEWERIQALLQENEE